MKRNLLLIVFALIILTALFIRVRASLPVASAQGESLNWEDFTKSKEGLIRFRDISKNSTADADIEKGVILSFIQDVLVQKKLEEMGSSPESIDKIVNGAVSEDERGKVETATAQLYGWNMEEFKKYVLYPQARRNILNEELGAKNIDFEKWLEKSLAESKISIYLIGLKWKNGEVVNRF